MRSDATEVDWQRVLYGLQRLWQWTGIASAGYCRQAPRRRRSDRTAAQSIEDAVALATWEDDGGTAVRRRNAPPARARPPGN